MKKDDYKTNLEEERKEIDLPEGITLVGEIPEITITISEKEQQIDIPEENDETDQVITEIEQPSISEE